MTLGRRFLNNGGKKGLNGNILGQHSPLILVTVSRQAGPMPVIWPMVRDLKISKAHPSELVMDDQHSLISVTFTVGIETLLTAFASDARDGGKAQ